MNKISLKNHNLKEVDQLSREQLKGVLGGYTGTTGGTGTGGETTSEAGCKLDSLGLCGGNCMRPGGAADKCRTKSSGDCTCGGL